MNRRQTWQREFAVPLQVLQTELNRLLEDYWHPGRVAPRADPPTDLGRSAWSPAVDVTETSEQVVVAVELPGVDPDSIDLSVTRNVLSLRGVKSVDETVDGQTRLRERQAGAFHREISLPDDIDFEAARAEARHGVLLVSLPKRQGAQPRTIPVQQG